jgi:hypothetical protein
MGRADFEAGALRLCVQDGVTVQQPVVNHPDGVTSGGNQFKVNEYGVILGNVGTGGSVDVCCRLTRCHARQYLKSLSLTMHAAS